MTCPNHNGPLCTTCKLAGLIRCPLSGVPLPLVDKERPTIKNKAFSVRLWPKTGDGVELKSAPYDHRIDDVLRLWKYINEQRTD